MGDWLYLIIGIAVVAVLGIAGLVTARVRGRGDAEVEARSTPSVGTDVIAPPAEVDLAPEAPVEEPPVREKPESTASRLVRLRQRLAGAQGGLGRGLLALLSRDRLDEDTWESIEDALLAADVGVAPTQDGPRACAPGCGSRAGTPRTPRACCVRS